MGRWVLMMVVILSCSTIDLSDGLIRRHRRRRSKRSIETYSSEETDENVEGTPARPSYRGHSVLRCTSEEKDVLELIKKRADSVWRSSGVGSIDVQVSEEQYEDIRKALDLRSSSNASVCEPFMKNLGDVIRTRETERQNQKFRFREHDDKNVEDTNFFADYRSFDDILSFLSRLEREHQDSVKLISSIGKSVEDRDIPALRICKRRSDTSSPCDELPKVYVQGLLHAREWIGGMACLYVANALANAAEAQKDSASDERIVSMLDNVEVVIVPIVNPDGYVHSWEKDRLWRKNRRRNNDGSYGVDLNRNFAVPEPWTQGSGDAIGASNDPSEEVYRGESSFSEPESSAVRDFVLSLGPSEKRLLGIDFHSYGQSVLRGFGFQSPEKGTPKDEAVQKRMGDAAAKTMSELYGKEYSSRHAGEGNFIGAGGCDDWLHEKGSMHSYTIELRDDGQHGFLLPPEEIKPTGKEALGAVLAMWSALEAPGDDSVVVSASSSSSSETTTIFKSSVVERSMFSTDEKQ